MDESNVPEEGKGRSRGINYLGNLGRILRDLTGFATLTFELLQNADDAGARKLQIDVGTAELVVFNDATFSDCGDQDLEPTGCLELAKSGHRCDFHSFRDVASGDKRARDDTTGAFGIGFIAVYQVTDHPVLESGGRRWDIDEMRPANNRILETPAPGSVGTTFTLPWAKDPDSPFRRATASAAVAPGDPQRLLEVLVSALPTAMLFLRHLREVELRHEGETVFRYHREDCGERCTIGGGDEPRRWLMLRGDFAEEAARLRAEFPGKIEDRRGTDVVVAIPLDTEVDGLLCSYLPTEVPSGLPAHVNADFFPGSDRKHLITDSIHGQWNRLAVRAAAQVLAKHLPDLTSVLRYEQIWKLIFAAYECYDARMSRRGADIGAVAYWEEIGPDLPTAPVMWSTGGQWTTPAATVLTYPSEDDLVPVLEQLGLQVMHPAVGTYVRRMNGLAGARPLSIGILAASLHDSGLDAATLPGDLPSALSAESSRQILWRGLDRMLGRPVSASDRAALTSTAVLPATDGRLWPPGQLRRADPGTTQLLHDLRIDIALLDETVLPVECKRLAELCEPLELKPCLNVLANDRGERALIAALDSGQVTADRILTWLHGRADAIVYDRHLRTLARALPIYPTRLGFRPLNTLVLPGGFTDRLGIAEVIDRDQVSDHLTFLQQLGAETLTLETYLTLSVPAVAQNSQITSSPQWRRLVTDIATRIDGLASNTQVKQALTPLPLVNSTDGFLPAASCYFPSETITSVLGPGVATAQPIPRHERSTTSLYEWLGVATQPRLPDVVSRVRQIALGDQDDTSREAVSAIVGYLGQLVRELRSMPDDLLLLRGLAWLPVRGDQTWHRPADTNTVFREVLFATQGNFLALSARVQRDAADFLDRLGVVTNPAPDKVISHLLLQSSKHEPVNREVYVELNRNAENPALDRLAGTECLLLAEGGASSASATAASYVAPSRVFRQHNPFGRFRDVLGAQFDACGPLLDRLGVKKVPDPGDALAVLADIAAEARTRSHLLVEDKHDMDVIWRCWQMLDSALAAGEIGGDGLAGLRDLPVVPNAVSVLTAPSKLLFDDMPGVATELSVGDSVIRRKEGAWRALAAAGVRSLTEAVGIQITCREDNAADGEVGQRIRARRPVFARVLDGDPEGISTLDDTLEQLNFPEAAVVRVRYHLPELLRVSEEIEVKALYVPAERGGAGTSQLISCRQAEGWPWMQIAKEFARALYPGEPPGPLASSLFIVLSAPTAEAAHASLDDAGWPRVDELDLPPVAPEPAPEPGTNPYSGTGGRQNLGSEPPAGPLPGPEGTPRVGGQPGKETQPGPVVTGLPHPPSTSRTSTGKRQRLRSYVLQDGEPEPTLTDNSTVNSAVDEAGVALVKKFECAAGRKPVEMQHHNPGYDVESRDEADAVLRHIEVKSTDGTWNSLGVGLTSAQFEFAQSHRDTFWLYVVENARDPDQAQIHRIRNPAGRVGQFLFDDGWKSAVSEENPAGS